MMRTILKVKFQNHSESQKSAKNGKASHFSEISDVWSTNVYFIDASIPISIPFIENLSMPSLAYFSTYFNYFLSHSSSKQYRASF